MTDLTPLLELDRQVLEFFNGSSSLYLDGVAMAFTSGYTWIPVYVALLFLIIKNNENMSQILLIIACALLCVFFSGGIDDYIVKPLVGRLRPTNDLDIKYTIDVVDNYREDLYGFFSAHAANTMSLAVFFSLLIRNRLLNVFLFVWSALSCWTRMYLGVHYPGDIIVGLLWGTVVGVFVYFLIFRFVYFRLAPRIHYISSHYTSTGYSHDDIDIVLLAFVVSGLYVTIVPLYLILP